MSNNNYVLALTVGAASVLLIGYLIYFDYKRRADPHYKRKLHERRQKMKQKYPMALSSIMDDMETYEAYMNRTTNMAELSPFDMSDHEIIQNFFQNEVKLSEEFFRLGNLDEGLAHMATAIMLCAQPAALMEAMKLALPNRVYNSLLNKLPQLQLMDTAFVDMDLSLD